ncbi:hypothetical protein DFJ58DRAFT_847764 [Suillus subalutaceus]|uniref:uncharacterized protein n=1 Tax=Suillus subalutaceus TaxID=48586 RepID=UPI001B8730AB|nr:uncharacterized protein DFJ58DRAFT_847764 [Suillus subalutaceus]KAG1833645.1 hypothetical protein DFJ58DRAFT_847764 [Suillus subalutaceus]
MDLRTGWSRSKREVKLMDIPLFKCLMTERSTEDSGTGVPVYTVKELYFHDTICLRSGDIELVVEFTRNRNHHRVCGYYFVDHPNRLFFRLHEIPTARIFDGVPGVKKWSHINFRQHRELYPIDKLPGPQSLKELNVAKWSL